MEIWKDIQGYEGLYQVSNYGRVKSLERKVKSKGGFRKVSERILKPMVTSYGYRAVSFYNPNNKKYKIHRLVVQAFLNNPNNYEQVNHIDGDKTNNHVDNLEWCSHEMNMQHAHKTGLKNMKHLTGHNHPNSKLTDKDVKEIREKYIPKIYTLKKLAEEYGVDYSVIHKIIKRKNWKHI